MLRSPGEVIRSLTTYTDWCQPSTASVITVPTARRSRPLRDGLPPGLLGSLDERRELSRRFHELAERDRRVLILWYLHERTAGEIAQELGVSRRQCFRLRARAIRRIVQLGEEEAAA